MSRGLNAALQVRDEAGVDEHAVEMARLGAAGAGVEQAFATCEDLLLFEERGIERQARRFLHDERQIGAFDCIKRGGQIGRREIDRVDRVIPILTLSNPWLPSRGGRLT
jgi:hypothetical protein